MRKKVLGGLAALVLAAIIAFNVGFNSSNNLSGTMQANAEAFADDPDEDYIGVFYCSTYPMPAVCVWSGGYPFDTGYRIWIL